MSGDAAAWQNFYLMTGGAAAALTGLIFVALSLQAKAIIGHPLFRDRALASLLSLLGGIFLSAAVLVPGQQPLALGLEVGLVAAFFTIRVTRAALLVRSVDARARRRPGRDRKSTRLNSSHQIISYAVFCLKKKRVIDVDLPDEHVVSHVSLPFASDEARSAT